MLDSFYIECCVTFVCEGIEAMVWNPLPKHLKFYQSDVDIV